MSILDKKRLTNETFKLDIERMRLGWYSDKYFENINRMLIALKLLPQMEAEYIGLESLSRSRYGSTTSGHFPKVACPSKLLINTSNALSMPGRFTQRFGLRRVKAVRS